MLLDSNDTTKINIGFYKKKDYNALFSLYSYLNNSLTQTEFITRLNYLSTTDYKVIVAHMNNVIVGMLGISYSYKLYCHDFLELHHMIVHPHYHHMGIGRKLIGFVRSYALLRDIKGIKCDSYLALQDSHCFYEACGFKKIGYHFHSDI